MILDITLNAMNNWPTLARPQTAHWAGFGKPLLSQSDTGDKGPSVYSDEQLLETILNKGSHSHFRMLVARYQAKVHSIALSILGPGRQSDAEDVAQDVFVKVYRQLDSFRGDSKFSTWLYRISFNLAIDHQRKHARHQTEDPDHHPEPASFRHAEHDQLDREQAAIIESAIAKLDPRQQMIVRLYYWQGFKTREIAEVLGSPEGTIKVYLLRARKSLALILTELNT
jgi:RNA polymerase sigma factor (sigma-70 family)